MIKDLKSKGMTITQIAKEVGVDRKTVSSWLKANTLPAYKTRSKKDSKLEPFKAYILGRMNEGCVNANVIFDEIIEQGYQGKQTILREYMRPHREKALSKASIRYETPPGKQAQVDWGEFFAQQPDGKFKKLYAFIMILGYSRDYFLEFTEDSKFDTLIGCHERALKYFGGVPETILYDNMKTVVAHSHKSGLDKWNQRFLRFADHHNFTPVRHRQYHPRSKGKVERGVKYVRGNFWPRIKSFTDLVDLNERALVWLDSKCNARLHQTTRRIPKEALLEERLQPMNLEPFLAVDLLSRKVMNDCMIDVPVPGTFFGTFTLKCFEKSAITCFFQKQLHQLHNRCQVEMVKMVKLFYNLSRSYEQPLNIHLRGLLFFSSKYSLNRIVRWIMPRIVHLPLFICV